MPVPPGRFDPALVQDRLEEASRTLYALRVAGVSPARLRSSMPEVVRSFEEAYGWVETRNRVEPPGPRAISRMDEAFAWVALIPQDRVVLRRVVLLRALTKPGADKPLLGWRRIGDRVGASHVAVLGWHKAAIATIVARLNQPAADSVRRAMSPEQARAMVERAVRRAA